MMSWCSRVTFQVSSMNSCLPISTRLVPAFWSFFSTTCWVAMPAWSQPGTQRSHPEHPMKADFYIFQAVLQSMAHMEDARDIGRGDDDDERLARGGPGRKKPALEPEIVYPVLVGLGSNAFASSIAFMWEG